MFPNVKRVNGIRIFEEKDFEWLRVLNCLKNINMPIKKIKEYIDLCALGDASLEKRLEMILEQVKSGEVSDFRMVINGSQRTTHSDSERVSGRARELHEKGFYFLKYNPKGSKPADIWDIIPEDTQGRQSHFAPYPEDLCRTPIILTCPQDGIVLDPFVV